MGIGILFLIIYRIKSLTKYLSQQRRLRRTPFHAPYRHYFILYVKRKGKNNISLQTLSIMYLYKANVRIVYDIFPYAHFPQQPVVLLTVWFGCLCFWTTNLRRFFTEPFLFSCKMLVFLYFIQHTEPKFPVFSFILWIDLITKGMQFLCLSI